MSPQDLDVDLLCHAANLITAEANSLRDNYNLDPQHPDWHREARAHAAHDDALCTALRHLE